AAARCTTATSPTRQSTSAVTGTSADERTQLTPRPWPPRIRPRRRGGSYSTSTMGIHLNNLVEQCMAARGCRQVDEERAGIGHTVSQSKRRPQYLSWASSHMRRNGPSAAYRFPTAPCWCTCTSAVQGRAHGERARRRGSWNRPKFRIGRGLLDPWHG